MAIMFADIVGFSALSASDSEEALKLVKAEQDVLKPIVEDHGGTWLRQVGDGLLLTFPSASDSVRCAVAIQSAASQVKGLVLRIGLHEGEVVEHEGDIYGDAVNIAARIEPFAAPGGVALSDKIQREIASFPEFSVTFIDQPNLKGIRQEVKIYCLTSHGLPETRLSEVSAKVEKASPALSGTGRRPGQSPYLNRVAIRNSEDFFGRTRELSRLFERLNSPRPQSISIVGERRIGKSSLLHQLTNPETQQRYLDDPGHYIFLLLDLQERRQTTVEDFFQFVYEGLDRIPMSTGVDETPTYEGFRKAVVKLAEGNWRLIFLLDEFEIIGANPHFDRPFFDFLRGLANNNALAYITSSGLNLQKLCATGDIASSPFFNIFWNLQLGPFHSGEAETLIAGPSTDAGCSLDPCTDLLLRVGGYFPFYLQIACSVAFDLLMDAPDHLDEDEFLETCRDEMHPHFAFIWQSLSDDERTLCLNLATGPLSAPRHPALRMLKRKGYITDDTGQPRLFSCLFEEFVQEEG